MIKRAFEGKVDGWRRPRGRPGQRWIDGDPNNCSSQGITIENSIGRVEWRNVVGTAKVLKRAVKADGEEDIEICSNIAEVFVGLIGKKFRIRLESPRTLQCLAREIGVVRRRYLARARARARYIAVKKKNEKKNRSRSVYALYARATTKRSYINISTQTLGVVI